MKKTLEDIIAEAIEDFCLTEDERTLKAHGFKLSSPIDKSEADHKYYSHPNYHLKDFGSPRGGRRRYSLTPKKAPEGKEGWAEPDSQGRGSGFVSDSLEPLLKKLRDSGNLHRVK